MSSIRKRSRVIGIDLDDRKLELAKQLGANVTLNPRSCDVREGVLDETGQLLIDHQVVTRQYRLELVNGVRYQIPVPSDYRNAEQAHLAKIRETITEEQITEDMLDLKF